MKKRLCVFLDGTWQTLEQQDPTNIVILAQSVAHYDAEGVQQVVFYNPGVGAHSAADKPKRQLLPGITGAGLDDNLLDAYTFLSWNYTTGDEIYIFGFSRGAFTARSLGGMIRNAGLLHRPFIDRVQEAFRHYRQKDPPDSPEPVTFRKQYSYDPVPITYIGLFDTVGQLGVPSGPLSGMINNKLRFHDLSLSSRVQAARQACAIDEMRSVFPITPWDNLDELNAGKGISPHDPNAPYQQRWFPGGHGEVGGGSGSKLSNIPLRWVADGAAAAGLVFTAEHCPLAFCSAPDHLDPLADWAPNGGWLSWAGSRQRILKRYKRPERPTADDISIMLSDAARKRWRAEGMTPKYRPRALRPFSSLLDENER